MNTCEKNQEKETKKQKRDKREVKTMLRGTSIFTCDQCGNVFMALDIEYNCMVYSVPQKCPKCGSYHTMPGRGNNINRFIYESIWKQQDEAGNQDVACYYPLDILGQSLKECEEWNSQDHTAEFEEEDKKIARMNEALKKETFWDQCGIAVVLILASPWLIYEEIKARIKKRKHVP